MIQEPSSYLEYDSCPPDDLDHLPLYYLECGLCRPLSVSHKVIMATYTLPREHFGPPPTWYLKDDTGNLHVASGVIQATYLLLHEWFNPPAD